MFLVLEIYIVLLTKGLLWSFGSWIYNYLFNQCLSPLTLRIQILLMVKCTQDNIIK
jgi:hypothetical protein